MVVVYVSFFNVTSMTPNRKWLTFQDLVGLYILEVNKSMKNKFVNIIVALFVGLFCYTNYAIAETSSIPKFGEGVPTSSFWGIY